MTTAGEHPNKRIGIPLMMTNKPKIATSFFIGTLIDFGLL
jgi:hypothetical protein